MSRTMMEIRQQMLEVTILSLEAKKEKCEDYVMNNHLQQKAVIIGHQIEKLKDELYDVKAEGKKYDDEYN